MIISDANGRDFTSISFISGMAVRSVLCALRSVPDAGGAGEPRGAGAPLRGQDGVRLRQVRQRQVREGKRNYDSNEIDKC